MRYGDFEVGEKLVSLIDVGSSPTPDQIPSNYTAEYFGGCRGRTGPHALTFYFVERLL
jgi:hypothetical protein